MINKNKGIIGILILISLAVFVSAIVPVQQDIFFGIIEQEGFSATSIPITNFNVMGFVCADSNCSTVSGTIFDGEVLNSGSDKSIILNYPTTLQSPYGYGVYIYKKGYIPWEQNPTWSGSTSVVQGPFNAYLTQKEFCRATVDNFEVINDENPNQPVQFDVSTSLDADTHAALQNSGPLDYIPEEIKEHYQVETLIELEIIDEKGDVIFTDNETKNIDAGESVRSEFTYIPDRVGDFIARITSNTTDSKCSSSIPEHSEKEFSIISENPVNMCYTLLNNLDFSNLNPEVGDLVTITANKISNEADSLGNLHPLPTDLTLTITKLSNNSEEVFNLNLEANPDAINPVEFSFDWVPSDGGEYEVTLEGHTLDCSQDSNIEDIISATIFILGEQEGNTAPSISNLPSHEFKENSGFHNNIVNLHNFASDSETPSDKLSYNIISESNPSVVSCVVYSNQFIDCNIQPNQFGVSEITVRISDGLLTDSDTFKITVNEEVIPVNHPPVLDTIGDKVVNEEELLEFTLSFSDPNSEDVLSCSASNLPEEAIFNIVTCKFSWTPEDGQNGVYENVIFSVSDGELTDSESIKITALDSIQPPVNNPPVIENILDLTFTMDSGLHNNILDLELFASDAETNSEDLIYTITSESNLSVVDCSIDGNNLLDCLVMDNVTGSSKITIEVSDGEFSDSDTFVVNVIPLVGLPPEVEITSPNDDEVFEDGENINFVGEASDPEDGNLTGDSLTWVSDIDGFLGNGQSINVDFLSIEKHSVTLTAIDSDMNSGSDTIIIFVEGASGGGGGDGGSSGGGDEDDIHEVQNSNPVVRLTRNIPDFRPLNADGEIDLTFKPNQNLSNDESDTNWPLIILLILMILVILLLLIIIIAASRR